MSTSTPWPTTKTPKPRRWRRNRVAGLGFGGLGVWVEGFGLGVRVGHRGVGGRWEGGDHGRGTAMRHDDERATAMRGARRRRAPLMGMSHRHARGGIMESHRRDPCPEWGHGNVASACTMPGPGITHGCAQCPNRDHADARCIVVPLSWEYLIVAHGNVAHGNVAHGNVAHGNVAHGHIASSPMRISSTGTSHRRAPYPAGDHGIASMGAMPGMGIMRRTRRAPVYYRPRMPPINAEGEVGHEPPAAGCIEALR
jgi:hypothetical protein